MTITDMLKDLDDIEPRLERINEGLKPLADEKEWTHDWKNAQAAYLTSGPLVTKMRMLRNLLLRVQAEGKE